MIHGKKAQNLRGSDHCLMFSWRLYPHSCLATTLGMFSNFQALFVIHQSIVESWDFVIMLITYFHTGLLTSRWQVLPQIVASWAILWRKVIIWFNQFYPGSCFSSVIFTHLKFYLTCRSCCEHMPWGCLCWVGFQWVGRWCALPMIIGGCVR